MDRILARQWHPHNKKRMTYFSLLTQGSAPYEQDEYVVHVLTMSKNILVLFLKLLTAAVQRLNRSISDKSV